jgi:hypothetical protein
MGGAYFPIMKNTFNHLAASVGKLVSPTFKVLAGTALALSDAHPIISIGGGFMAAGALMEAFSVVRKKQIPLGGRLEIIGNAGATFGAAMVAGIGAGIADPAYFVGGVLMAASQGTILTANIKRRYNDIASSTHTGLSMAGGLSLLGSGVVLNDPVMMGAGACMTSEAIIRATRSTAPAIPVI